MENASTISLHLHLLPAARSNHTSEDKKTPSYNSAFPAEVSGKLLSAYLLDYATYTSREKDVIYGKRQEALA